MIYNNKFIWIHFPKNAGTKIEKIFDKYFRNDNSIQRDKVGVFRADGSLPWHDSIEDRMRYDNNFIVGNKKIIICVRRLESWLKSRYQFEVERSPHLQHDFNLLNEGKFLEANGFLNNADAYIKKFFPMNFFEKGQVEYIRVEFFEKDFKKIFSKFIDISLIPDYEFSIKVNKSKSKSLANIDIEKAYRNNPLWKELDQKFYPVSEVIE